MTAADHKIPDNCGDEEGDVPPLEDLSEALKYTRLNKQKEEWEALRKNLACETKSPTKTNREATTSNELLKLEENSDPQDHSVGNLNSGVAKKSNSFGGLKKGFLSSSSSSGKAENFQKKKEEKIEYVKPKVSKEDQLKLEEVQQAMKLNQSFIDNKDQWLTADLLTRIQTNPSLCKQLCDPAMLSVLQQLQADPAAAANKYKDDPNVSKFLKDFSAIMGKHFEDLSEKQKVTYPVTSSRGSTSTQSEIMTHSADVSRSELKVISSSDPVVQQEAEEQRQAERLLEEPEIREILLDKQIQELLTLLKQNPDHAQSMTLNCYHPVGKTLNCYLRQEGHPALKNLPHSQRVYNFFVDLLGETRLPSLRGIMAIKRLCVLCMQEAAEL